MFSLCARVGPAAAALAVGGLMFASSASALELRGVRLPERIVLDSTQLVLNGAGVLVESSMDRFVVGLYLTRLQSRIDSVLADKGRKRIVVSVLRPTAAARLIEMLSEAISANHSEAEVESIRVPLDELYAVLGRLGMARAGAALALDYVPGAGTQVVLPEGVRGGIIRGAELYQAVLRAWLGADPVDRALRGALLGAPSPPGMQ